MKTSIVTLIVLVVLGGVVYMTRDTWMPLVNVKTPIVAPVTYTPQVDITKWTWVMSATSTTAKIQYQYPNPLPTKYVTAQNWPPIVDSSVKTFSCVVGTATSTDNTVVKTSQRVVGGRTYCVDVSYQGAAGSTYTSYDYATQQGTSVAQVAFTLRTPQCANYDAAERAICTAEQSGFPTDSLADRIASSIRAL